MSNNVVANSSTQTGAGVLFSEEEAGRFALGFIALDRPGALNALALEMLKAIGNKLLEWRARAEIACVVFHAESEKAFCAGGDAKSLALRLREDGEPAFARDYFTTEYFVDYLIHAYPKPVLCWADGITFGGGVGIMNGATYRVTTERSSLAMPETAIGLFPDVGSTYFLNRLPAGLGLFLGLSGARFSGFDAAAIGMAEGVARSECKKETFAGLSRLDWTSDPQANAELLRRYMKSRTEAAPAENSALVKSLDAVARLTDHSTIDAIDRALREWRGEDLWLKSAIAAYLTASPTAVKTTFEQLRRGKKLTLKEAFLREWDMEVNYCTTPDFTEGVRARLIDKDNRPRWNPPALSAVADETIERYFRPQPDGVNLLAEKLAAARID
jgi:enoyl-CoA hydratase/carnithine racemase